MQYHNPLSSMGIAPHSAAIPPPYPAGPVYLPTELLRMHQLNTQRSYDAAFPPHPTNKPSNTLRPQTRLPKDDPASKLQRLMDQSIVQEAIDQAIKDSQTPQTSNKNKRSHAEFQEMAPATFGKLSNPAKKNAFAAMMGVRASQKNSLNPVVDFEKSVEEFQQYISGEQHEHTYSQMDQGQQGRIMSICFSKWVEKRILPHFNWAVHPQTKINALHVLIDIATGIAYTAASGSSVSKSISDSDVPRLLIENMYKIVERMAPSEMKLLKDDEGFIYKVKTLRQKPLLPLGTNKWDDLDEVMRVVKYDGPVNFKRFYSTIEKSLDFGSYKSAPGDTTIRIIRNDIVPYVTRSMCFETKYNALNILADIGKLVKTGRVRYEDEKLVYKTLFGAMSTISALMDESEVAQVVSELQSDIETCRPGWLNNFSLSMESFESYRNVSRSLPYLSDLPSNRGSRLAQSERLQLLKNLVEKETPPSGLYGQKRLLVKLLFLRWSDSGCWGSYLPVLNAVLAKFPDRSVPLQTKFILEEIDLTLEMSSQFEDIYICGDFRKSVPACIESNLSRAAHYATRGTTVEIKLSALDLLVEIGLRIVEWCHKSRPPWQRNIFQDHIAEDSVTDSMMFILSSLSRADWPKVMEDQNFLGNVIELDVRRSLIPESMEGLDVIIGIIQDPKHNTSQSSRRMKVVIDLSNEPDVIDLTED